MEPVVATEDHLHQTSSNNTDLERSGCIFIFRRKEQLKITGYL